MLTIERMSNLLHPKYSKSANLKRGRTPLSIIIIKTTIIVFVRNQKAGGKIEGPSQPPKNNAVNIAAPKYNLMYKESIISPKLSPEYSAIQPDAISVSASGISKGSLSVSAITATKNINAPSGRSRINQKVDWALIMELKLSDSAKITTPRAENHRGTSYETC